MLKIVSDPTTAPILALDLVDDGGRWPVQIVPSHGWSRDLTWSAPDGSSIVYHRDPRRSLRVRMRLDAGQYRRYLQMVERGDSVYVVPDFDEFTALNAPLSASTKAWRLKASDGSLEKISATIATRASVAYYEDPQGWLRQAASGVFRFQDSAVGKGVVLESGRGNLFTTPHPSSGSLGWTAGAGSPTLSWDTTIPSKYIAAGGVMRARGATGSSMQFSMGGTCSAFSGNVFYVSIWAKGNGRCDATVVIGTQSVTGLQYLLDDEWQEIKIGPFTRTTTTTTFTVTFNVYDDGADRTVYVGPSMAQEWSGGLKVPDIWTDQASPAGETLLYTVAHNPGNLTIISCGRMPENGRAATLWSTSGSGDTLSAGFSTTGVFFDHGAATDLTASIGSWSTYEGQPYHFTCKLRPGEGAKLRLAVRGSSGAPTVIASASDTSPEIGDYSPQTGFSISNQVGPSTIQHLRYDHRGWSDAEIAQHERLFLEEHYQDLLALVTGRRFRIVDDTLEPLDGRLDYWGGQVSLEEIDLDSDFKVAV